MTEKMIPVIKTVRFDFVVKKNRARHGALAEDSEAVVSLAGTENFADFAWLVLEVRLLCWRFCSTAGGMRKVLQMPYVLCLEGENLARNVLDKLATFVPAVSELCTWWERMLHCLAAVAVLVTQGLLVLFAHARILKHDWANLENELSFHIPVLSTCTLCVLPQSS